MSYYAGSYPWSLLTRADKLIDWGLSDTKSTYIGPLEPGSVVGYRAEVSLSVLEGVRTERYNDVQGHFRIRQR
ncbi:MAG: hypothetical protein ACE5JD_15180 [Candidatus Methylomirabilia bacterium]